MDYRRVHLGLVRLGGGGGCRLGRGGLEGLGREC